VPGAVRLKTAGDRQESSGVRTAVGKGKGAAETGVGETALGRRKAELVAASAAIQNRKSSYDCNRQSETLMQGHVSTSNPLIELSELSNSRLAPTRVRWRTGLSNLIVKNVLKGS